MDFTKLVKTPWLIGHIWYYYNKILRIKPPKFVFNGETYNYFFHKYNTTWRNERTVEIPIFWKFVEMYGGGNILEVGNVLSHYFCTAHDIVDKYEEYPGVINADVINFKPKKKYDLIISISTLEHVGWDEYPRQPMKFLSAIENLKKCLTKKGKIIFTVPLGYNTALDDIIKTEKIEFIERYYLKRVSIDNMWRQVSYKEVRSAKYNNHFPFANGLFIGVIQKKQLSRVLAFPSHFC